MDDRTRGYARTRAYTRVHARTRGYTRVHAGTRGYTRVRVLTLNSMYLAHKWTQKWTKYATGEDAGSGAWTIGHAGTRVHARTRGYTRVHAGTRAYTRVHAGTRGYTRVRVLTLNSMYLAHKWTQKWTKYATGEDVGSGVWTIGHAGSRGFARVHARTFPCTYFGSLNAQMDRGSPYDGYNTLKTTLDCDVCRQSQPMSRAKTESETETFD